MNRWVNISIIAVLVVALVLGFVLYFQESGNLKTAEARIADLEGDVSSLEDDVTLLELDLETAEGEISTLESDLAAKETEVFSLQSDLAAVEAEISDLETDLTAAEAEVSRLEGELSTAQGDITGLEGELAAAQAEVDSITQALAQAQDEKAALETQLSEWASAYTSISNEIFLKLGIGDDASSFITPNDPVVNNLATAITGGYSEDWNEHWRDIKRLYSWVVNNIEYNHDTPVPILPDTPDGDILWIDEYWRTPSETVEAEVGDCEDMALLLQSLVLNYENEQFPTWAIGLQSSNGGHLAVALPVGDGNLVILDPAGIFFTSDGGDVDTDRSVTQAINDWLQHWSYDMPDAYVDFVFDSSFSVYFEDTDGFIDWAVNQF